MESTPRKFLTAEWRHLLMANYEVSPDLLKKYIPRGTELDFWEGKAMVSMVGFLFLNTRVLGLRIPFHRNFEEVNLRFYVKYKAKEGWRRGVVFIKEVVPKFAISTIANLLFDENYITLPMDHEVENRDGQIHVRYSWTHEGQENYLRAIADATPQKLMEGSEEEFIAEHYWGYTSTKSGETMEYRVEHPRWDMHRVIGYEFKCNVEQMYGHTFKNVFNARPSSVFLAAGSEVSVMSATRTPISQQ